MSSTGPVGVGLIGAGNISTQYLENLTQFPDVEVRFIADLVPEVAQAQAEKFGIAAHGTVEELLADEAIEIVVNLTIPAVHAEVATRVLDAGKHVWSEKPIALDRDSGKALLEHAQSLGLRVATAPDTFLGAGIQSSLRAVESGRIGSALTALTLMQSPGPESWHPNPAFLFDVGAGPLFDIGPYYITTLVQFFGPVKAVHGVVGKAKAERVIGSGPKAGETFPVNVPTHVAALIEFESGQTAQSTFSFDSKLGRTQFEVAGDEATLTVPDPNTFDGELVFHTGRKGEDDDGIETAPATGSTFSRGTGVVELARAIRAGVPERASGEMAFHVLDVMQSIIESGESGQPVQVASTFTPIAPLEESWSPAESTLGAAS